MDNQRLLVWAAFGLLAWLTYQQWINDYSPSAPSLTAPVSDDTLLPAREHDELPTLPDVSSGFAAGEVAPELPEITAPAPAAGLRRLRTDCCAR